MEPYYETSDGQRMFDRTLKGLGTALRALFKILVYLPLLFIGFLPAVRILDIKANPLPVLVLTLLFAFVQYLIIFFIKGMLIAFKLHCNLLWVPLFILCIACTCIMPVYVAFEPIQKAISRLFKGNTALPAYIVATALGLYVYSRYRFLENIAPRTVFRFYQMGINTVTRLQKMAVRIRGNKSKELL